MDVTTPTFLFDVQLSFFNWTLSFSQVFGNVRVRLFLDVYKLQACELPVRNQVGV